ncbi:hypothetical protein OG259_41325 (plasmid) [Streptomyces sp. NBC_00250]|uniref:hypothetical protein n=1 Tax=Streptomyces sp. NBC_00250 TaxID=2903641 RepID=UPI002E2E092D|nr:hypothetical protein [Streptomyces sp. NBC_00250]
MTAIPLALDGYLDSLPAPGDDGLTARFRLISSPTDDAIDDTVWDCHTADPRIAHELLTLMRPGDLLRIGGHLVLPGQDNEGGPRLSVDALELLLPAPDRHLADMVLDRYGPYPPQPGQLVPIPRRQPRRRDSPHPPRRPHLRHHPLLRRRRPRTATASRAGTVPSSPPPVPSKLQALLDWAAVYLAAGMRRRAARICKHMTCGVLHRHGGCFITGL